MNRLAIFCLLAVSAISCSGADTPAATKQNRTPLLGFSPWPFDATIAAVDWTWATIVREGDIVSQHLEEGVPWLEALSGEPFPSNYSHQLSDRRNRAAGKKVLLQISPLNLGRDGLAPLRSQQVNARLPAPWNSFALNHPKVKVAYLNYALRLADTLAPDVLQIGIEVNLLKHKKPELWAQYVDLQCATYTALKRARPSLVVTASVVASALFPEWSGEYNLASQQAALTDIARCTDQTVFSVHPFMSALLAEGFPHDYFEKLIARLPTAMQGKPLAISESSYPAQVWNLNGLTWNGTPAKQSYFVRVMLDAAQRHDMQYVIWFSVRDFDQLWEGALGRDQLALIWRDTGLFDEEGKPREALKVWHFFRAKLNR